MIYHLLNLSAFQVEAEKVNYFNAVKNILQIKIWKHKEMLIYSLFILKNNSLFHKLKT